MDAPRARQPQAVLFACGLNSVRSPMAASLLQQMFPHALYVRSAGVRKGELDPFAVAVMAELGQDISGHKPTTFEKLDDWEGLNFDLIITLSPEELDPPLEGDLKLVDAETGEGIDVTVDLAALDDYKARLIAWQEGLEDIARKRRASYVPLSTDTPLADLVFAELRRRRVVG